MEKLLVRINETQREPDLAAEQEKEERERWQVLSRLARVIGIR